MRERPLAGPAVPPRPGAAPSAAEAEFLALLNRARANPAAYGHRVGVDLRRVRPAPALVADARLVEAARVHSADMADRRYFAHVSPDGRDPGRQIGDAGVVWVSWGQSIAAGYRTPADALAGLVIDAGVAGSPHRRHLLGVDRVYAGHRAAGVGVHAGGPLGTYVTVNTAAVAGPARPAASPAAAAYVRAVFAAAVGRQPDADEATHWQVVAGTHGGLAAAADGLLTSYAAREALVQGWYHAYLGRPAARREVAAYTGALALGCREEEAVGRILGSEECVSKRGGPAAWVPFAFLQVLGRRPRPDEVTPAAEMVRAIGPARFAMAMALSPEGRRRTCRAQLVALGRPGDGGEVDAITAAGHHSAAIKRMLWARPAVVPQGALGDPRATASMTG